MRPHSNPEYVDVPRTQIMGLISVTALPEESLEDVIALAVDGVRIAATDPRMTPPKLQDLANGLFHVVLESLELM